MVTSLICALLMLVCAAIIFFYPKGYNQYRHYEDEEMREASQRNNRLWGRVWISVYSV